MDENRVLNNPRYMTAQKRAITGWRTWRLIGQPENTWLSNELWLASPELSFFIALGNKLTVCWPPLTSAVQSVRPPTRFTQSSLYFQPSVSLSHCTFILSYTVRPTIAYWQDMSDISTTRYNICSYSLFYEIFMKYSASRTGLFDTIRVISGHCDIKPFECKSCENNQSLIWSLISEYHKSITSENAIKFC